jgi:hypothetical protein
MPNKSCNTSDYSKAIPFKPPLAIILVINYMLTATRQAVTHIRELRRFVSRYTLQGKPDTHDTYAFHDSPCMPLIRLL